MNRHYISAWMILMLLVNGAAAQTDTVNSKGSVYFRSMRIIGKDTIVEEKRYNLDKPAGDNQFSFRFGDGADTSVFEDIQRDFKFDFNDTLDEGIFGMPFRFQDRHLFEDSVIKRFRLPDPGSEVPGQDFFHYDFREPDMGVFRFPELPGGGMFKTKNFPVFSVEDVAIYPESNSVRNFTIRPLTEAGIFLIEAELSNKRSSFTVYNNRGKLMIKERFRPYEGTFRRVLTLDDLKAGTYFVEVKNGKSIKKKRLTIG
jgi:hypothetical protein